MSMIIDPSKPSEMPRFINVQVQDPYGDMITLTISRLSKLDPDAPKRAPTNAVAGLVMAVSQVSEVIANLTSEVMALRKEIDAIKKDKSESAENSAKPMVLVE